MHTPESTTHSYCEWHTRYGGGIAECCQCYPDKCKKNRKVKEEDIKKGFMDIQQRIEEAGKKEMNGNKISEYKVENFANFLNGELNEAIKVISELDERVKALEEYIESKKDQLI